jgi:hypothetical protein
VSTSIVMPRLSESLTGPKHPALCQSCGAADLLEAAEFPRGVSLFLSVWQEHDEHDRPERVFVVLCGKCEGRLIEKHPRLYARVPRFKPTPGVMALCVACKHRDGVTCKSPLATFNGGAGMTVNFPEPTRVHICRRGKGLRSGWETLYPAPPNGCEGREVPSP